MSESSDFFKYGRGYARYMQGITDVGKQGHREKNADGKYVWIDAPQDVLRDVGVERDTLLLARSIGEGMTLDEYKKLHDHVAALQTRYRNRELTNAAYQEQLWQLPKLIEGDRKAGKQTHYKPNRDASGQPVATAPDVSAVPLEKMKELSPDLAALPDIDIGDFWKEVEQRAATDDPRKPLPKGSDAEPTQSPQDAGVPPVVPSRKRGVLDQIQAGLDAVGIVEPTPFADGTNAAISAMRAIADPKNAGDHLRNAGISLVSAFIPYAGDTLKFAKYGAKAPRKGTRARKFADLLGMPTGGGSSGGGGGGGGGGHTGGAGASDGENGGILGSLANEVADGFGNLAEAMGPVGKALAGTVLGLKAFVHWLGKIDAASQKTIENNRELALYSGSLAGSYAQLDNQRLLRDIEKSQEMSGPLGRLTKAQSRLEDAKAEFTIPASKVGADLQALLVLGLTKIIETADYLEPITEYLMKLYKISEKSDDDATVLQYMARQANERMAKRRI